MPTAPWGRIGSGRFINEIGDHLRVLVLWADPQSANLGVRVLASGVASLAKLAWGDETHVDFQDFGPGDSDIGFGGRTIVKDLGRGSAGPIRAKLAEYDIILDSGAGDSFTDIYGVKRLGIIHYAHRSARRVGTPVVLAPQTIGPFSTRAGRTMARSSLRLAAQSFARDRASADCAAGLGVLPELTTDVVFALGTPQESRPRDVVFNVSGLLWNSDSHGESRVYRRNVLDTVRALRRQGRNVSLLAHVLHNESKDNDVPAVREVPQLLGEDLEVIIPTGLEHARSVLSCANIVIGARMHACLNAISTGTPAIPWAYSRKFAPLMGEIGWPHTIETSDEAIVDKTLRLVDRGEDLTRIVQSVAANARERLSTAVDLLRNAPRVRP